MKKNVLVFVALIAMCVVGCDAENADWDVTGDVEEQANNTRGYGDEPFSYSIQGVAVLVSKTIVPFGYTAEQLAEMASECGIPRETIYFEELVRTFLNDSNSKIEWIFKFNGESQSSDSFVVTLLQNSPGYKSMEEFQMDFALCYAGGYAYPTMINKDWLLLVNSCGTGFDDGSGMPIGCQKVKDIVYPSLKLF